MKRLARLGFVTAVVAAACSSVWADINVGVVVSTTGPAASLGIPEKNTIALLPQTILLEEVGDAGCAVETDHRKTLIHCIDGYIRQRIETRTEQQDIR